MLRPGDKAPPLSFSLLSGESWHLNQGTHPTLTLISFYRGAFCRFCRAHLRELDKAATDLMRLGIPSFAVSVDDADKASSLAADLALRNLSLGYGLTIDQIRDWGLFASLRTVDHKTEIFAEPALVFVRPDATLYALFQNSMSCGRPDIGSLVEGLARLAEHDFPLRGSA